MRRLFALLACLPIPAAAAVATLEGEILAGPAAVDAAAGTASAAGRALRLADLDRIDLPLALPAAPGAGLWLADGGWIPGTVRAAAGDDRIVVDGPWGAFTIPLAAVRAWGDAPAEGAREDELVLDGGVLRGRVEGIRGGAVVVRSVLKPDPVPLDRIRGLRLAVAVRPPRGTVLTVQPDPERPPLAVTFRDGAWRPAAALDGALPAGDGVPVRVEGPRRGYLSELTPALVEDRGAFGVVWPWQRDRDLDGGALRLGGRLFPRGIAVHSEARLQWPLKGQFARLRGALGIADLVAPEGDCIAVIAGDGRELLRHRARGGEPPLPLDIDLAGIQVLELRVEQGERHDIGDHLVIADGTLVRLRR
ncbi:MAG: hypothetical protein RLZZ127_2649 [Planctomycetota bacterium]|jgi:hypothetical protein